MTNYGLFIGWNRAVPGREMEAGELFASSVNYFSRLKDEGKIDSFEPVIMTRHGGDLNGFFILRGDRAKLHEVETSVEYTELLTRVDHVVLGLGSVPVYLGDMVRDRMDLWRRTAPKN